MYIVIWIIALIIAFVVGFAISFYSLTSYGKKFLKNNTMLTPDRIANMITMMSGKQPSKKKVEQMSRILKNNK